MTYKKAKSALKKADDFASCLFDISPVSFIGSWGDVFEKFRDNHKDLYFYALLGVRGYDEFLFQSDVEEQFNNLNLHLALLASQESMEPLSTIIAKFNSKMLSNILFWMQSWTARSPACIESVSYLFTNSLPLVKNDQSLMKIILDHPVALSSFPTCRGISNRI